MDKVINLVTPTGQSPAFIKVSEELHKELWDAIDKASHAGIPYNTLLGQLLIIQADIMESYRDSSGAPQ